MSSSALPGWQTRASRAQLERNGKCTQELSECPSLNNHAEDDTCAAWRLDDGSVVPPQKCFSETRYDAEAFLHVTHPPDTTLDNAGESYW
eukprot:3550847-Amphidinium_carterae.1